ncbi:MULTISPECIES: sigma-S stabilization anti-adapter protein IraP [Tatumella]|uniref:Sigma-S stabilization anti-adapter protein IraP n=1 Tax=Tatumella punctata TaxID=399969 RepID=A0ABW1VMH4_9GAMM|nr:MULTISPECIES: sigma-S stabilization anti-adapter protein IraP [unclassified Tatumella]MBS0875713.1 hypothetical protein [Tatumella sp. JGM82]MBS0890118.1 hypothetical protein [Tatumella sp. JGM94]MBS0893698.1 hypothetical protein [Tatumella sp. JGM130]MBS0900244.1 hypothetical protein [Tatumella sp. JGM100]
MNNLIAELLIKLAEKDEEYKLQTERMAAMEVILSLMLESLPAETVSLFEEKFQQQLLSNNDPFSIKAESFSYSRCLDAISAIKYPLSDG